MVRRTAIKGDTPRWKGSLRIDQFREDLVSYGLMAEQEPHERLLVEMFVFESVGK